MKPLVVNTKGRSKRLPYLVKNFFYRKKTKQKGVPKIKMQSMEIYKFQKPVDTIFPKKETVGEVKTAFLEAFKEKKDFETDGEKFVYSFGDTNIKITTKKDENMEKFPNSNDFVSTHLINQYKLPEVLRFAYSMFNHTMNIEMYKMTDEQINKVIDSKVTKEQMDEVISKLDEETLKRNMEKIKNKFAELFQNMDLEAIEEISKFIDIKNKYTKTDTMIAIAKNLSWDSVNQDPRIQYTYYKTPSTYWRPIMPAISNYDPREIVMAITIMKKYSILPLEIIDTSICMNEIGLFFSSVLEMTEFQDCSLTKFLSNRCLYDVIF